MLADRVKESSTTTGTGTLNLDGAATGGFVTFVAAFGTGGLVYYCIQLTSASEWEVGIGTVTDGTPDTLTRTTPIAGSAALPVSFSAGTKDVFCTHAAHPAGFAVRRDIVRTGETLTIPAEHEVVAGEDFIIDGTVDGAGQLHIL